MNYFSLIDFRLKFATRNTKTFAEPLYTVMIDWLLKYEQGDIEHIKTNKCN